MITCDNCGKTSGTGNPVGTHWICEDCKVSTPQTATPTPYDDEASDSSKEPE